MAEKEIALLAEHRPALDKPMDQWTLAEILSEGARYGLISNLKIAQWEPRDELDAMEIKRNNLISQCGANLYRTMERVQEAALRREQYDKWPELLARVEAAKRNEPKS